MSRIYELLSRDNPPVKESSRPINLSVAEASAKEDAHNAVLDMPTLAIDKSDNFLKEVKTILRNLLILLDGYYHKRLMFCNVAAKSGASTVAINLSALIARELHRSCLLLEANPFSPALHKYLKGNHCNGFCQLVEDQRPVENYILKTTEPQLFAIGAGVMSENSNIAFNHARIENALNCLKNAYPLMIIDGPTLDSDCAYLQLSRFVDGVILIVRTGELAEKINHATACLEKHQAKILGIVMNTL